MPGGESDDGTGVIDREGVFNNGIGRLLTDDKDEEKMTGMAGGCNAGVRL